MKMELYDFIDSYNLEEVGAPALIKQRDKLNENIFNELNHKSIVDCYDLVLDEAKTYKRYILIAIDGSDCEISNT